MSHPTVYLTIITTLLSVQLTIGAPQRTGTLPCLVVDKSRGLPVPSAMLCIKETDRCLQCDTAGTARFTNCIPGIYEIFIAADTYDTLVLPNVIVNAGDNTQLRIELPRSTAIQELDRMAVSAKRIETKKAEQITSVTRLGTFELENTAGTANDVNRVLQTLPSVITGGSDLDNTLFVRGGHARENIFIIDGIELDNISHFSDVGSSGGSLGFIDGALLQSLDFYAGGIPAPFPPRMSAVADMTMRNGSTTDRAYNVNLASSGLGLAAEGPFPKNTGSYLVAARYVDLHSIQRLIGLSGIPRFGDSQSRFNFNLNARNTLTLSNILSFDDFTENATHFSGAYSTSSDYRLLNYASGLQWNSIHDRWNNRLMASAVIRNESGEELVAGWTGPFSTKDQWYLNGLLIEDSLPPTWDTNYLYHTSDRITERAIYKWRDNRRTFQLKNDVTLYLRDDDQLSVGIYGSQQKLRLSDRHGNRTFNEWYWIADSTEPGSLRDTTVIEEPFALDSVFYDTAAGGYVNYVFRQGAFKTVVGLRGDYFRILRDYGFSPRLACSFDHPVAGTFGISGGLYYQPPGELSRRIREIINANPNYTQPRPAIADIELQRSWQGVVSYEKQLATSHVLTVEAYYKWYDREYTLFAPFEYEFTREFYAAMEDNRPWHLKEPDGKKKAYGIELSFQKKKQRGFYYALGYTWFSVQNRYANGKWYNDFNNLRNHGNVTLGFEFLKRHSIATRMSFSEGRPYCAALILDEGGMVYDTTRGYFTERIKEPVVSINLRYNFRFFPRFGTVTGYIELWNVLNYTPVIERRLSWWGYNDYTGNGFVPLAGVIVDF